MSLEVKEVWKTLKDYYLLIYQNRQQSRKIISDKIGISYDTRTESEVIVDLNDSGINAYPNVIPFRLVGSNGLNTYKGKIFPLGGISNITTVLSGFDLGYYPTLETDEHGFINPKGLYNKKVCLTKRLV